MWFGYVLRGIEGRGLVFCLGIRTVVSDGGCVCARASSSVLERVFGMT